MKIYIFLFSLSFFCIHNLYGQKKYYQSFNSSIVSDSSTYIKELDNYKENFEKNGLLVKDKFLLKSKTKDSVIYYFNRTLMPREIILELELIEKNLLKKIDISDLEPLNDEVKLFDPSRPTLINFWFTSCPPCITELPTLNSLRDKYGDKMNFIAITFNDKSKVLKFLEKYRFNYIHLINSKDFISSLGINSYPVTLYLDKEQNLVYVDDGIPTENDDVESFNLIMERIYKIINILL